MVTWRETAPFLDFALHPDVRAKSLKGKWAGLMSAIAALPRLQYILNKEVRAWWWVPSLYPLSKYSLVVNSAISFLYLKISLNIHLFHLVFAWIHDNLLISVIEKDILLIFCASSCLRYMDLDIGVRYGLVIGLQIHEIL